ncbi:MAG: hypothetical protein Q9181_000939 [Wetmoreana brouardii]
MHTRIAALMLGALAAIGSSSPVASPEASGSSANSTAPGTYHKLSGPAPLVPQAAQAITHLYVCIDINFQGRCESLESTRQGCYTLFNGFDNTISSLRPDSGTTCQIYDDPGCAGASINNIVYPGIANLVDYGFNDRTTSYRCN